MCAAAEGIHAMRGIAVGLILAIGICWAPITGLILLWAVYPR